MAEGTKIRNIRVDDALWAAAKERAEQEGTDVAKVVRRSLQRYAKGARKTA